MPDELEKFQTTGPSWSERAALGELEAVLSPTASKNRNTFLHNVHLFGAWLAKREGRANGLLLDFGCGTGRFVRYFGERGFKVLGTEITPEMLAEAKRYGLPRRSLLVLTDGVTLPVADASVDMIWCCGVLRYALFTDEAVFKDMVAEMRRVLKPGGIVANVEIYLDTGPAPFNRAFEAGGFKTRNVRVLQRYSGRLERYAQSGRLPQGLVRFTARAVAGFRYLFDKPQKKVAGLRDYFFVWVKH